MSAELSPNTKKKSLEKRLSFRPDAQAIENLLKTDDHTEKVDPSLQGVRKKLERNMVRSSLAGKLSNRPGSQDLSDSGYLDTSVDSMLNGSKRILEKKITGLTLNNKLGEGKRMTKEELIQQGIMKEGCDNALQGKAMELEKSMNTDKLSSLISNRPEKEDLSSVGILKDDVDGNLQSGKMVLEKKMKRLSLAQQLEKRPMKDELSSSGILKDDVDGNLQSGKVVLEKKMKRLSLSQQLDKRPSLSELEDKGILDNSR